MESKILDAVFQDNKPRTVLSTNHFGDILFSESNGQGETYKILQIYINNNNLSQTYNFEIKLHILGENKKEYDNFLKKRLLGIRYREDFYEEIMLRYDLYTDFKKNTPKKDTEIYVADASFHDRDELESFYVLSKDDFYTKVLNECTFNDELLSDLTEIGKLEDQELFYIQKIYWGYSRKENKEGLYDCINLKHFAVWNEYGDYLNEQISKLQNLSLLSVSDMYILPDSFLDNIYKLPYLVSLELNNKLTKLPQKINQLQTLKYLQLNNNQYTSFKELLELKSLKVLNLANNKLTSLDGISELQNLEMLNLSNNSITEIPSELKQLRNLKILNITKNPLKKLPDFICDLTQLEELHLSQTQLENLPENVHLLSNLKVLNLTKNPFLKLPKTLSKLPKKIIEIEFRNKALYDSKAKQKLDKYPKGTCLFTSDFNFKLMVIQKLMFEDEVLLPKFDIHSFAKRNKIDLEEKGYDIIPEAALYFKNLKIPKELLIDVEELLPDGGDEIYAQIIPYWDGEDETFAVENIEDIKHLPRLKKTNTMNFKKDQIKQLRAHKIKVSDY